MIIGLTGAAFAGKDTAGLYLARTYSFGMFAFADPLRDMLEHGFGIHPKLFRPENKETVIDWISKSPRQLMQTLGTEWGRNMVSPDIWCRAMMRRISAAQIFGDDIVITDVRFVDEAVMIRRQGGEIWRIVRPESTTTAHNHHISELGAQYLAVQRTLTNGGTLEQLYEQIDAALDSALEIAGQTIEAAP